MNSLSVYYKTTEKVKALYSVGIAIAVISAVLGIVTGSTVIDFSELLDGFDTVSGRIFLYVRLPRTLGALICGMALAVSGAVLQTVLSNKLAAPSIIGINSGAGLAVTVCAMLGIYGGVQLSVFSFVGAFFVALLVSLASRRIRGKGTVILVGVAFNSLFNAMSDIITSLYPELRGVTGDFKIGVLSSVSLSKLIPASVIVAFSVAVLLVLSSRLSVLSLGDDNAYGLGLNPRVMRCVFLIISALLAGSAVSIAGLLSFVGLIVPHTVRRLAQVSHKHLIVLSAIYGGGFVCLCDTLARVLFAPYEIPVGVVMAFLGAPAFVFLLISGRERADA